MVTINIFVLALILIFEAIIFTFIGIGLVAKKKYEHERIIRQTYLRILCNKQTEGKEE